MWLLESLAKTWLPRGTWIGGGGRGEGGVYLSCVCLTSSEKWGAWVAQLVWRLTFGFSSGHDLMGYEIKSCVWLRAHGESA